MVERHSGNQGKTSYSAPGLTVYGSVKKLTAAGTGSAKESGPDINSPLKKP